ncbi:pyridoxamine 5'-phosphate oxidase [Robiginitomaculum antarcticum]|uniref:pyridoxamine 5'-phosphate oxidase n=1 Tax=Robiginitomaculum antarcticum TaxID=437507 RepID=UPI00035EF3AC|nr:pyridoxamine 5'-phosphate oxidase [Robiginitomaculum antarcticum]
MKHNHFPDNSPEPLAGASAIDPLHLFKLWMAEAMSHKSIKEANAMNLATVSASGRPSNRIVLLKDFGVEGFVFYTNLNSHKGVDLKANPHVALCFYWESLGKQIRIEGVAEAVEDEEADRYFASRPRQSQIGAWASAQSQPLKKASDLTFELARQAKGFGIGAIARPPHWSGFRVNPLTIEFWKRGKFRVHTRDQYKKDGHNNWNHTLLSP